MFLLGYLGNRSHSAGSRLKELFFCPYALSACKSVHASISSLPANRTPSSTLSVQPSLFPHCKRVVFGSAVLKMVEDSENESSSAQPPHHHHNVTMENVASSMKQMTLQPSKDVPELHSTNHDIPASVKDVNFNSISSCHSKKRCRIHNKDSTKGNDSFKGKALISSFRDSFKGYNHNDDTSIEQVNTNALALLKERPKELDKFNMPAMHKRVRKIEHVSSSSTVMIPSADATSYSRAAMRCNHSNQKGDDEIFGISEYELVKAIEEIVIEDSTAPLDHQVFNQKEVNNPIIEEKSRMVDPRWGWMDAASQYERPIQKIPVLNQNFESVLVGNYLLLELSNQGTRVASSNDRSNKEATIDDWIPRSLVNQAAANQNDILTNKNIRKIRSSRSELLGNQAINQKKNYREGNLPCLTPINQRLNTGTVPTLLRTTSIGPRAKIDQVEKHQPCYSNQRSELTRNKTSAQKDRQSHQIISMPSLLEEKSTGKINSMRRTTHQRRGGTQKKNDGTYPANKHLQPKQKAKARKTSTTPSSVSSDSSHSSDSSFVTSSSGSTDSVTSRSTKTSRRKSQYSTVDFGSAQESRLNAKTEKQVGRLQRFKNKLGLIFHHHHHHHHHHHDESKVTDLGHATALSNNHSHLFFNYLRKMLHRTSKDAEPKKKTKQHARLPLQKAEYGLKDGLLKHVWHSKKPKRSDNVKKPGKSLSNNNKVKKWHWWQKLHKRKGIVRQVSRKKSQVRLGFKAKKPPLRALTLH